MNDTSEVTISSRIGSIALDENQMAQVDDAIAVSFGLPGGGRAT